VVEGVLQLHFESLVEGSSVPEMLFVPGCGKDDADLFPPDRTLVSPVYRIAGFMKIVDSFPREVSVLENVLIPMGDGIRLAARIWHPADARASPVPAILEFLPYRQADRMRDRDEPMHGYLAGHGYASVRVDLRGTGDSEGILLDEYHRQEIEDALEVIRWIRTQPWCSGNVGMMGISWGGFNALQVAAKRPEGLCAIASVCASDDRYADDAHYMGGCLLNENLVWGSALFTLEALPPDPRIWGERWRTLWHERLEGATLFSERWLRHQHRDDYWKHGSVSADYDAIACPVYAIGGWADAYTNSVPRLLERLRVPRKGLVGPWAHAYPHLATPGPAIGFLQELLRWWDRWLLGRENGIMEEPRYRVFMPEPVAPSRRERDVPGRWVAEADWPSSRIQPRAYSLGPQGLEEREGEAATFQLASSLTTGSTAGSWCPFGSPDELPGDQGEDDLRSLLFDSQPFRERFEILGACELRLMLASDSPGGLIAARIEDVFPDGASARVTYALLNLTHRESHEDPRALFPGETYGVTLRFKDAAHAFLPGHRIRVALSTAYWPIAWPSPWPFTLTLHARGSRLQLPVRPPRAEDAHLRSFEEPEGARGPRTTELQEGATAKSVSSGASGEIVYRVSTELTEDGGPALTRIEDTRIEHGHSVVEEFSIVQSDPLSAKAEILHDAVFRRDSWSTRVRARTRMVSDSSDFHLEAELEGFEGDQRVYHRAWSVSVPRDGV
jgi:putative CocE/NonD family hydrolase